MRSNPIIVETGSEWLPCKTADLDFVQKTAKGLFDKFEAAKDEYHGARYIQTACYLYIECFPVDITDVVLSKNGLEEYNYPPAMIEILAGVFGSNIRIGKFGLVINLTTMQAVSMIPSTLVDTFDFFYKVNDSGTYKYMDREFNFITKKVGYPPMGGDYLEILIEGTSVKKLNLGVYNS